ncbi:MAG: LacI family DNA-binding transcriptional regulator [Anaerolineales bacterium]|uniref:LacI family DNA-binding transcriptional regulator n=1 Tax=Promineifilum sp. TaxID=2664178 RepID=UPI001D4CD8D1|nr:LacI family DNA-binding transcriptional regulator [Anaerolineales bacterium]MCO5182161.1 LacI family DNA-binding transcriptional regulator [Promineifilum sp.]
MTKISSYKKRPSMQDVATLAGVSRTTASFVINNVEDAGIPQDTRLRVWDAVKQLGYRPNAIAQGLRSAKTHTIGFISDEVATSPFAGEIIHGAQDRAWEDEKLLLLINTGGNRTMKQLAAETLLQRQVEGVIYATMYHREVHPPESIRQVPTVLLDCFVADGTLPSIVPDEVSGGSRATSLLLERGHRRIGFINDSNPVPASVGRLEGYKQALAAHNVPFDESLVFAGESIARGGYECAMQLMKLPDRPTALFCFNDRMAMGAYDALRNLGLSIPGDVAVVGFDNQEVIAASLYPALTTMELPHYQMGRWAVDELLRLLAQGEPDSETPVRYKIDCPLISRDSV